MIMLRSCQPQKTGGFPFLSINSISIMALAQRNSYAKHSHIRCPPILTIFTAHILKIVELGISVTFIVSICSDNLSLNSAQVHETQPSSTWPVRILWFCSEKYLNIRPLSVLRVHNLPCFETLLGKERQFYVTVTNGKSKQQTRSMQSTAQRVEWNENLITLWEMSYFHAHDQLSLLQCCTTALPYHNISLCEKDHTDRHPCWKAGVTLWTSTRFIYFIKFLSTYRAEHPTCRTSYCFQRYLWTLNGASDAPPNDCRVNECKFLFGCCS